MNACYVKDLGYTKAEWLPQRKSRRGALAGLGEAGVGTSLLTLFAVALGVLAFVVFVLVKA